MTNISGPIGYYARQREKALELAPPDPIDKAEFIRRAERYPLPVLRQAAISRYSSARGRTYEQVLARLAEHLSNPHINRGDDYRLALGHIEATRRWMDERGLR